MKTDNFIRFFVMLAVALVAFSFPAAVIMKEWHVFAVGMSTGVGCLGAAMVLMISEI